MAADFDFSNSDQIEKWLRAQPRGIALAIAARSALRVLPLVLPVSGDANADKDDTRETILTLQAFRAALSAWTGCLSDYYVQALTDQAAAAAAAAFAATVAAEAPEAATKAAANAAAFAASKAAATGKIAPFPYKDDDTSFVADAAHTAALAATRAAEDVTMTGMVADGRWLERNNPNQHVTLIRQPLWLNDVRGSTHFNVNFPIWARTPLDTFDAGPRVKGGPWGVWLAWYREVLSGQTTTREARYFSDEKAFAVASKDDEFWARDPDKVTADVASIVGWTWTSRPSTKQQPEPSKPLNELVRAHSDEPTKVDQLNRRPFARALVERIDDVYEEKGADGFAVHVHAPLGAGKTSVLLMMREIMTTADRKSPNGQLAPRWVVVHFDAWKNERRSPPWWPLMEAVKTECLARLSASKIGWLRVCGGLLDSDDQAARLEGRWLWWKIKTDALPYVIAAVCGIVCLWLLWFAGSTPDGKVPAIFEWLLKLVTAAIAAYAAFAGASRIAVFGSSDSAKFYEDISQDPLKRITGLFRDIVDRTRAPVCIFIDDLDRCGPDYVVDLLEGIQNAFRHRNVAYVVAADRNWIKASFENRYGMFASAVGSPGQPLGHLFLEKVFQVSTPLPGMGPKTRAEYWDALLNGAPAAPPTAAGDRVSTAARAPRVSERAVEEKREEFRNQYGDNFTRDTADKVLKESDTPEIRAAAALELSASPATREEAKHLLSQFKDIVPDIPRVMKRMINAFALRQAIGILEGSSVSTAVLARWTILEQRYPALADLLAEHPEWLDHIAKKIKEEEDLPDPIKPFVNSSEIIGIVGVGANAPLREEVIRSITRGSSS